MNLVVLALSLSKESGTFPLRFPSSLMALVINLVISVVAPIVGLHADQTLSGGGFIPTGLIEGNVVGRVAGR
jgi:hypothetical protein